MRADRVERAAVARAASSSPALHEGDERALDPGVASQTPTYDGQLVRQLPHDPLVVDTELVGDLGKEARAVIDRHGQIQEAPR